MNTVKTFNTERKKDFKTLFFLNGFIKPDLHSSALDIYFSAFVIWG